MNAVSTKKTKTQSKQFVDLNPVEAFRDLGGKSLKSLASDFAKSGVDDLWNQILGGGSEKAQDKHGELQEGEEISFEETKKAHDAEPGIDYRREILHSEKKVSEESRQIEMQIQQIVVELKKLTQSSTELHVKFRHVVAEELPENPGKYHLTFFEWLLSSIRIAQLRVEDSSNWLSVFASKKKKQGYWNMFKKHGTTFALSNERVLASQTG